MVIKLVCSNYYHTQFNAEVLMEAAKQSDWKPVEPYNSLAQAIGDHRVSLSSALNVATGFLFQLWRQPILPSEPDYLVFCLLKGLTSGRKTSVVLELLENRIHKRFAMSPLDERDILSLIRAYERIHPF